MKSKKISFNRVYLSCGVIEMNYIEPVQKILDYVEKNIGEEIRLQNLADMVYISPYHLSRIFKGMIGVTLQEYIRRRRLSESAKVLLSSDIKILEIALSFGFESQEAFSRSFKQYFACNPAKFRKEKPKIWFYEKVELNMVNLNLKNNKGGINMEYKIVERDEIKLVGIKERIIMPNNTIPKMWVEFLGLEKEIKNRIGVACYGLADNMSSETYEFDETVGVEVTDFSEIPEGMINTTLKPQKYLVFTHKGILFDEKGESKLHKTYDYIYGKLIPTLEYEVDNAFNFELYDERFIPNSENSEMDIYVPIK